MIFSRNLLRSSPLLFYTYHDSPKEENTPKSLSSPEKPLSDGYLAISWFQTSKLWTSRDPRMRYVMVINKP